MTALETVAGAGTEDATLVFARHVADRRWAEMPAAAETATRIVVSDAIGCAISGATTAEAQAALRAVRAAGGDGSATVVGSALRLRPLDAAFANTLAARALLFDDTHARGYVHAGAAMTFTALAVAEELDATFGELLGAVGAGVEIAARVGAAAGETQYAAGVHTTGTVAPFGTAATAARLHMLSAEQTQRALSLAGEHAAGVRQYQLDGSSADSALHAANAARSGIASALLAREGFPAAASMIEGRSGFLAVFRSEPDTRELLYGGLGDDWLIVESCIKPYPNCRSAHSSATAIENLIEREGLGPDDVAAIRIAVSPHGFKCDRQCPTTSLDAQFSIQYAVASLLARGSLTDADFAESELAAPDVLELQRRMSVAKDEALGKTECRMEVERIDGTTLTETIGVGYIRGDPKNPMSVDQVGAKFLANVRASGQMPHEAARVLLATLIDGPLDTPVRDLTAQLATRTCNARRVENK